MIKLGSLVKDIVVMLLDHPKPESLKLIIRNAERHLTVGLSNKDKLVDVFPFRILIIIILDIYIGHPRLLHSLFRKS